MTTTVEFEQKTGICCFYFQCCWRKLTFSITFAAVCVSSTLLALNSDIFHRTGCTTCTMNFALINVQCYQPEFDEQKTDKGIKFPLCSVVLVNPLVRWKHKKGSLSFVSSNLLWLDFDWTGVQAMQISNCSLIPPWIASFPFSLMRKIHLTPGKESL